MELSSIADDQLTKDQLELKAGFQKVLDKMK